MSTIQVWATELKPGDVIPYTKELGYAVEVLDEPRVVPSEDRTYWGFPAVTYTPGVTGKIETGFTFMAVGAHHLQVIRPGT